MRFYRDSVICVFGTFLQREYRVNNQHFTVLIGIGPIYCQGRIWDFRKGKREGVDLLGLGNTISCMLGVDLSNDLGE